MPVRGGDADGGPGVGRAHMHISHLKAMGRENWGRKIPRALALMESAGGRDWM